MEQTKPATVPADPQTGNEAPAVNGRLQILNDRRRLLNALREQPAAGSGATLNPRNATLR